MLKRFLRNCFAKNPVVTAVSVVFVGVCLVGWAIKAVIGWFFLLGVIALLVWMFWASPLLEKLGLRKKTDKPGSSQ